MDGIQPSVAATVTGLDTRDDSTAMNGLVQYPSGTFDDAETHSCNGGTLNDSGLGRSSPHGTHSTEQDRFAVGRCDKLPQLSTWRCRRGARAQDSLVMGTRCNAGIRSHVITAAVQDVIRAWSAHRSPLAAEALDRDALGFYGTIYFTDDTDYQIVSLTDDTSCSALACSALAS